MMRKIQYAAFILAAMCILSGMLVAGYGGIDFGDRQKTAQYSVTGSVYDSYDGKVEIYNDTTGDWVCKNITVYSPDGVKPPEVDNETTDTGSNDVEADTFLFDDEHRFSWRGDTDAGRRGICVGEAEANNINYVFITNFTFGRGLADNWLGFCEIAEWEPIPQPIIYLKGDSWINITIPKFTNPQKELYGDITPNADNTIGFAVYRNGTFRGNTTFSSNKHYFFNDTISSGSVYNYSVLPILKGNYTAYGRSANLSSDKPALATLNVALKSPNGGEYWTGGSEQNIRYTITGGLAPYTITLKYSTDSGNIYPNIINNTVTEAEGECTYAWALPETNPNAVKVKVEVTDDAFVSKSDASDSIFVIDSIPPTVESTIPSSGGSVSITKPITIVFSEKMNQTATVSAFSISPNPSGWVWAWNDAKDTMTGTHNNFIVNTTYTVTITTAAKDLAGNCLANDYSWNFTANMSVCLNSPKYGDAWTGGVEQGINYTISGGTPNYKVKIYYSYNGGNWSFIAFDNQTEEETYEYLWSPCPSIDSKTVNVKIVVVDGNETESIDTSGNFEIDSTAPWIVTYSGNDTYITTTEPIMVVFSEEMNKLSAESAFVLKDSSGNPVNGTFSWNGNAMSFAPNETLLPNMNYTAAINTNATDKSDPGNWLDKDYSWNFTAIEGRGDFTITLDVPPSPEKGKTYTITVTVSNTGDEAFNISGLLTVKFYESRNGETWTPIDTKYIQNIWAGNSSSAYTAFTFDDYGNYYFLVEVTSKNPADTFPGGEKTGRASASVNIPKPGEEIGMGPYTLIALMVVIVIIVAAMILLSLKKKGELTLKEKEEGKEEAEKESEEEK